MARDALIPQVRRAEPAGGQPATAERGCPNCRAEDAAVRYDFGAQQILRCNPCGLLYLHPWPSPEETQAVYGDNYFENQQFMEGSHRALFGYADYVAERFNKQVQFAK